MRLLGIDIKHVILTGAIVIASLFVYDRIKQARTGNGTVTE